MSEFNRNEEWMQKESWINDFVSSPRRAKDLVSTYIDYVYHGVKDNEFNSLEDAIADLKTRVEIASETEGEIRRVASFRLNEKLTVAKENILNASQEDMRLLSIFMKNL